MSTPSQSWLETLSAANSAFRQRMQADQLPVQREPCPYALITCMDPRVNTARDIGIASAGQGALKSFSILLTATAW